jgi:hypothetical protein
LQQRIGQAPGQGQPQAEHHDKYQAEFREQFHATPGKPMPARRATSPVNEGSLADFSAAVYPAPGGPFLYFLFNPRRGFVYQ